MPSTACDQCFRRKQPCLGGHPSCQRCSKTGLTCTYSTGKPVGKPKGHKKRRIDVSSSSATSSALTALSPTPVNLQNQRSVSICPSRESSVTSPGIAIVEHHKPKSQKRSHSPDQMPTMPVTVTTVSSDLNYLAVDALPPPFLSPPCTWSVPPSISPGPSDRKDSIFGAGTETCDNFLQQQTITNATWAPHADLLEWQAMINKSAITATTDLKPTTLLGGTQLYTEPTLVDANSNIIPLAPPLTQDHHQIHNNAFNSTVYKTCQFKVNQGTDDQHLETIRDTINCVESALLWPSCTDTNCFDVCLMDCILALQQCVECLSAVVSGPKTLQNRIEAEGRVVESPQLQAQLLNALASARLHDVDRLTLMIRQLLTFRGMTVDSEDGYLIPLLDILSDSIRILERSLLASAYKNVA